MSHAGRLVTLMILAVAVVASLLLASLARANYLVPVTVCQKVTTKWLGHTFTYTRCWTEMRPHH